MFGVEFEFVVQLKFQQRPVFQCFTVSCSSITFYSLAKCLTVYVLLILQAHVRQTRAEFFTLCLNCELRYKERNYLDGSSPSSQWQARQLILTLFLGQNLFS